MCRPELGIIYISAVHVSANCADSGATMGDSSRRLIHLSVSQRPINIRPDGNPSESSVRPSLMPANEWHWQPGTDFICYPERFLPERTNLARRNGCGIDRGVGRFVHKHFPERVALSVAECWTSVSLLSRLAALARARFEPLQHSLFVLDRHRLLVALQAK